MSTHTVEIVVAAQDKASAPIAHVEGSLLALTKSTRMMHRETYGVSKFANALDTLAGTQFGSLISSLQTIGDVARPLKDIGKKIETTLSSAMSTAWSKVPGNATVSAAASRAGTLMSGTMGDAIKSVGAVAIGAALAIAIDQAAQEAAGKLAELRGTLTTALAASSSEDAAKIKAQTGPWADLLNLQGSILQTGLLGDGFKQVGDQIKGVTQDLKDANTVAHDPSGLFDAGLAAHSMAEHADEIAADAKALADKQLAAYTAEVSRNNTALSAWSLQRGAAAAELAKASVWEASGMAITADLAKGLQDTKGIIKAAMDKVKWAINHPLAQERQEAKLQGAITHIEYLRAVAGNTPGQNAIFDQQIAFLEGQWTTISGEAYDNGQNAAQKWRAGYSSISLAGAQGNPFAEGTGHGQGQNTPHRAAGGPVNAGQTYVVGERGPEYLHMGSGSGSVTPHGGGGGGHSHDIYIDGKKVMRAVDPHMGMDMARTSSAAFTRG